MNEAERRNSPEASSWLHFIVCGLPLFLLLLAFAFGVHLPWGLYVLVLFWCMALMLWLGARAGHAGCAPQSPEATTQTENSEKIAAIARGVPQDVLELRGWEVGPGGLTLKGRITGDVQAVRDAVAAASEPVLGRRPLVLLHEDASGEPYVFIASQELEQRVAAAQPAKRPWVNLALFLATLVTTTLAGVAHSGIRLLENPSDWPAGLPYGLGVILILGVHEMGHYLTARKHGVRVSLPYFIPVPFALGTFGAFISMPALLANRRQLFDIGVAGPLAGLAAAIPALALGLQWSELLPAEPSTSHHMSLGHGLSVNSSLLLAFVAKLTLGERLLEGHYLVLHPLAFAGWLGLMLTALNLLPVGQLDGGHVSQALFGRARADWLGKVALFAMVGLGLFVWSGLLFWALIVFFIAGRPGFPPIDALTPLDPARRTVGWGAFLLLGLILLPLPHALSPAFGLHCPYL